jgi:N-acetyl-1-D-myo-inositol-2-amino-2-deoxy-alpha-D-glucopyranoside deacetylase
MDTPDNHRRLGELRAAELEAALGVLGVTEWENLGYRDSDMMGRPGNRDPRTFWLADLDEAARRLVWLIRLYQPDVITTYNEFGGYGHPDHIRSHDVAVRAFPRAGDTTWYPEQVAPELGGSGPSVDEGGLVPWSPAKLYEQVIPSSVRARMEAALASRGMKSFWSPPADATPEQIAEMEAFAARMRIPDQLVTTWIDVSGEPLERKWKAFREHRTQISDDSPFMLMGIEGWRDGWDKEAYILRESRVETAKPESDLFAGIV